MDSKEIREACVSLADAIEKNNHERAKALSVNLIAQALVDLNNIAFHLGELVDLERQRQR